MCDFQQSDYFNVLTVSWRVYPKWKIENGDCGFIWVGYLFHCSSDLNCSRRSTANFPCAAKGVCLLHSTWDGQLPNSIVTYKKATKLRLCPFTCEPVKNWRISTRTCFTESVHMAILLCIMLPNMQCESYWKSFSTSATFLETRKFLTRRTKLVCILCANPTAMVQEVASMVENRSVSLRIIGKIKFLRVVSTFSCVKSWQCLFGGGPTFQGPEALVIFLWKVFVLSPEQKSSKYFLLEFWIKVHFKLVPASIYHVEQARQRFLKLMYVREWCLQLNISGLLRQIPS